MSKTVEFFFDYISPASYFAHLLLPDIAKRTGAEIIYRPFLLGGVFKSSGNTTPLSIPAKGNWMFKDLKRYAKHYKIKFELNHHFPFPTINLLRGALWIQETGDLAPYSDAIFRAAWAEKRNLGNDEEVVKILKQLKIDSNNFNEAISRQHYKDKLRANTDEAVRRGAFGAPTMFVGEEMFWGQDRLDFVEEELTSS